MELFSLKNQVALVTGGNRGLGKEIALGLAKAGADIAIVQRSEIESEVVHEINKLGRRCITIHYDLTDSSNVEYVINKVINELGKLDILINNAGVQHREPSETFPENQWDFVMNVNAKTVFYLCQAAGKHMLKQGKGKIINLASLLSFQGGYTVPAYAASKGAIAQLIKALSNEWASRGINVNGIAPGYMQTDMNVNLINDETRNRQILERIPAGRWGKPEDLVGAAIFLSSPASNYVNGEIITVDGGWMGR
ncbi:SDR family NAD(P)-dependent oxidoreductase [Priestia megaterium]|uniref:SDR family NAD(P)-dependent oxidoreductase n=1 Tax=Priestia megaterium TaxID=1404 RepID=UPI0009908252|nr:SDR family NAD(P)-dependent oxidoreductase [Priestia megaterium]AQU77084.1 2-deoxy-D-gluconate 3-dehydrogenase [Priestia megaterium]